MKAALSRQPGGPETLTIEDIPAPRPGAGEVLISVHACGVNYPDVLIIQDLYQVKPQRPFAPGGEVAGIVEAIGAGVTTLRPGDRVAGTTGWGGMAEKIVLHAERCVLIPSAMPFDDAAALLLTYGTSYYALKDRASLQPGETLLVLGAAGGVGLAAVELGSAMGARVIAAVSTKEKLALALNHGAQSGIVYPSVVEDRKALAALFKEACGSDGANVIYDPVGGVYAEAALRAIGWEGRFLVVGFPAGIPKIPLNLALLKSCQIVGVSWGAFTRRDPARDAANNRTLLALYAEGKIKPFVTKRFPLELAGDAIAWLAGRHALGKVVVTISEHAN